MIGRFRSNWVILYFLAFLAFLGQSDLGGAQTHTFLSAMREGHAEYDSGHFASAERLFAEALVQLGERDESQRAVALADLGAAYDKQEALQKAEKAYSE